MKALRFGVFLVGAMLSFSATAQTPTEIFDKVISQGVYPDAFRRLVQFMDTNQGQEFVMDTYSCKDKPIESIKPCSERDRSPSTQTVQLGSPRYVAIVNYSLPSSQKRFHFIDLKTGDVENYYVSHGLGTGESDWATKFSNIKDSRQTSLGFHLTGNTYHGKYGRSLRMYGLEKSNDQAYNRDIVMHGAWYSNEDFMSSYNRKTGFKFGRLGLSWGCPAVGTRQARKLIPLLQAGALIYHYHRDFADKTDLAQELVLERPLPRPQHFNSRTPLRPAPRPAHLLKVSEPPEKIEVAPSSL